MAKKRPPPRIGTRRQQVWRKELLPSYGWYVSIYMCQYLHCCTYGLWMVVSCMVYLPYIRVHTIFIDVHTVWSLSYHVWWHWPYKQYLPCKWSLYILLSYVWYIHMYPHIFIALRTVFAVVKRLPYIWWSYVWYVCFHIFFSAHTPYVYGHLMYGTYICVHIFIAVQTIPYVFAVRTVFVVPYIG